MFNYINSELKIMNFIVCYFLKFKNLKGFRIIFIQIRNYCYSKVVFLD